MRIEQTLSLAAEPDAVWAAFHDVRLMVECLPGAALKDGDANPAADEDVPLVFKVKLGPIAASFAGQGRLTLDEPARTGSFAGQAVDARSNSRVKGVAQFTVAPAQPGTHVVVAVDHSMAGPLAQFSREGIVRALAEQLTAQFASHLQARLPAAAPACAGEAAVEVPSVEVPSIDEPAIHVPPDPSAAVAPFAASPNGVAGGQRPEPMRAATTPETAGSIDLWALFKAWLRGRLQRR